ncbi:MAG: energy transducer TonB [Elusimicrobiota bacterium]
MSTKKVFLRTPGIIEVVRVSLPPSAEELAAEAAAKAAAEAAVIQKQVQKSKAVNKDDVLVKDKKSTRRQRLAFNLNDFKPQNIMPKSNRFKSIEKDSTAGKNAILPKNIVTDDIAKNMKNAGQDVSPFQKNVSGPAGTGLSVDAAKFPYSYYLVAVKQKVDTNWRWTSDNEVLKTLILFRILRDGKIEDVKVDKSSGDQLFDIAALRAVKLSDPLPPLPEGYKEEYLRVYYVFTRFK